MMIEGFAILKSAGSGAEERPATAKKDEEPGRLPFSHASVSGSVSASESKTKGRIRFDPDPDCDPDTEGKSQRHHLEPGPARTDEKPGQPTFSARVGIGIGIGIGIENKGEDAVRSRSSGTVTMTSHTPCAPAAAAGGCPYRRESRFGTGPSRPAHQSPFCVPFVLCGYNRGFRIYRPARLNASQSPA
jgi:hypothetical protein